MFMRFIDLQDESRAKTYTNQTGKFPVRLIQGNQYLMIMCKMNSNFILIESMRDRVQGEIIDMY